MVAQAAIKKTINEDFNIGVLLRAGGIRGVEQYRNAAEEVSSWRA
jgi:hypothetical protein